MNNTSSIAVDIERIATHLLVFVCALAFNSNCVYALCERLWRGDGLIVFFSVVFGKHKHFGVWIFAAVLRFGCHRRRTYTATQKLNRRKAYKVRTEWCWMRARGKPKQQYAFNSRSERSSFNLFSTRVVSVSVRPRLLDVLSVFGFFFSLSCLSCSF